MRNYDRFVGEKLLIDMYATSCSCDLCVLYALAQYALEPDAAARIPLC